MVIQAVSAGYNAGNFAKITINDILINPEAKASDIGRTNRGLHVIIMDSADGSISLCLVFDTYKSSDEFEDWISKNNVNEGMIVIAACKDDCTTNMSLKVIKWFKDMGSQEITKIRYRQGFAFIGVYGGASPPVEKRAPFREDPVQVTQIVETEDGHTLRPKDDKNEMQMEIEFDPNGLELQKDFPDQGPFFDSIKDLIPEEYGFGTLK